MNRTLAVRAGVVVAGIIAVYVIVTTAVNVISALLPIAALGALGYLGYRVFNSRPAEKQQAPATAQKSTVKTEAKAPSTRTRQPEVTLDENVTAEDFLRELSQPNISRLEEKEQRPPEVTDAVRAQIEERRKRLGK